MTTEATETAQPHGDELEMIKRVLAPLGKERADRLTAMVSEYLEEVSPITWCADEREQIWELGKESPLDPARVIFAMFYSPEDKSVIVYSFTAAAIEGREGALVMYFREIVLQPRYTTGPIALAALSNDLEFHLTLEDEPEPEPRRTRTNGGA